MLFPFQTCSAGLDDRWKTGVQYPIGKDEARESPEMSDAGQASYREHIDDVPTDTSALPG